MQAPKETTLSKQDVENFLKQLTDDRTLREQLSAILADAEDSAIGETVIAFATEAGFDISATILNGSIPRCQKMPCRMKRWMR